MISSASLAHSCAPPALHPDGPRFGGKLPGQQALENAKYRAMKPIAADMATFYIGAPENPGARDKAVDIAGRILASGASGAGMGPVVISRWGWVPWLFNPFNWFRF